MKTLDVNVPDGYEIDIEKSNIVFKKIDDAIIRWNKNYNGVEIKADGEHFVVDANPSYVMNWYDAVRFYNHPHRSHTWGLPTITQLQVIAKYLDRINDVIREKNGFKIIDCLWSCEEVDGFFTWLVYMSDGDTYRGNKYGSYYVRAVSAL